MSLLNVLFVILVGQYVTVSYTTMISRYAILDKIQEKTEFVYEATAQYAAEKVCRLITLCQQYTDLVIQNFF